MYQSFPQKNINRSNSAIPIIKEPPHEKCAPKKPPGEQPCACPPKPQQESCAAIPQNIFGSLKADDLVIIGILLILLYEGTNDMLIIAILGIILFF